MPNAGDIRRLTLDKVDYRVTGGSDFSRKTGKYTKESVPTSGRPDVKWSKQNEDIEGIEIQVDGTDRENIRDLANRQSDFDMAYVTANGDTYTSSGQITITGDSTADGKMTLTVIPTEKWTAIVV
jgi:hypothetical protein